MNDVLKNEEIKNNENKQNIFSLIGTAAQTPRFSHGVEPPQ